MIILVGKSGSGKTSIQEELIKDGKYKRVVTYTTRSMREGEIDGVTYHFISSCEFLKKQSEGFFVETTYYDVASGERWFYGTSSECFNDDNSVLIMNPDGIKAIKGRKDINYTIFYIMCDNKTLKKRLKKRGDNPKEAKRRLKADKKDFKNIEALCDYTIMNGDNCTPKDVVGMIDFFYEQDRRGE
ncbi:MAG: guanylate kinase [Lachnospiraceae bacterium]|nr:guanylate kinase [Lachnospiraceae bacterium]